MNDVTDDTAAAAAAAVVDKHLPFPLSRPRPTEHCPAVEQLPRSRIWRDQRRAHLGLPADVRAAVLADRPLAVKKHHATMTSAAPAANPGNMCTSLNRPAMTSDL